MATLIRSYRFEPLLEASLNQAAQNFNMTKTEIIHQAVREYLQKQK